MHNDDKPLYTVQIVFHSAQNLPVADFRNFSCDPYLHATLTVPSYDEEREERDEDDEDPPLTWRTPTAHKTRDPVWNWSWIVSGVPKTGFRLKMRVIDEDLRDRDDRMGKAYADFTGGVLDENFESKEMQVKLFKRKGSIRPWIQTYLAAIVPGQKLRKHNRVCISVKVLGRAQDQKDRRVYTLGPNTYSRHFSPMIGHIVHRKPQNADTQYPSSSQGDMTFKSDKRFAASTFIANKIQLSGPAPRVLRHHYVAYNRILRWLFSNSGIFGHLLYHGIRKQYRTVYSHDKRTLYGVVHLADDKLQPMEIPLEQLEHDSDGELPPQETLARRFLDMTDWGRGGKVFTYIITLDCEWRFTETGDEFSIDMLSKHSMHADGAKVIMFSGEFFVRKIRGGTDGSWNSEASEETSNVAESSDGGDEDPVADGPKSYELIIDNSSGTYRPKANLLPVFEGWLKASNNLGALGRVAAMNAFDSKLKKMKEERKEERKKVSEGARQYNKKIRRQGDQGTLGKLKEKLGGARSHSPEHKEMAEVIQAAHLKAEDRAETERESPRKSRDDAGEPGRPNQKYSHDPTRTTDSGVFLQSS